MTPSNAAFPSQTPQGSACAMLAVYLDNASNLPVSVTNEFPLCFMNLGISWAYVGNVISVAMRSDMGI